MPLRVKTPCNHPGCGKPVRGRYCGAHAHRASYRPSELRRGTAGQRGYDRTWRKLRQTYVRRHPFCEDCLEEGIYTTDGIEVDHVIPIEVRPDLRLVMGNLRSRCRKHHRVKTLADRARYGKGLQKKLPPPP